MTDTMHAFRPAILVDWDTINPNGATREDLLWDLTKYAKNFDIILLVTYPDYSDYVYDNGSFNEDLFTVVIRNTGKKREIEFKMNALSIMREVSSSRPVAALDESKYAGRSYRAEGLIVL